MAVNYNKAEIQGLIITTEKERWLKKGTEEKKVGEMRRSSRDTEEEVIGSRMSHRSKQQPEDHSRQM